jgi:hypothetical protein
MTIQTDSQGRLYLSADLREQYGKKFHVVEYENRLELIPIDEDPLKAVREEVGTSLDGVSRTKLRQDGLERARQEAASDLEQEDSGE